MSGKKRVQQPIVAVLLLIVAAFAVYSNSFSNEWTYDDFPVIVENPDVRSIPGFLADSYPSRPLREITYLLDYQLFGYEPFGWHFQQVLWHALNGCLILLLATRIGLGWWAGAMAAMLFLVHPLQVEVVANISHRKESLALFFALLSLLSYIRACRARSASWLLGAVVLWGVAFAAKQTVVGLPILWLTYEWAFLERGERLLLRDWKALAVAVLIVLAAGLIWAFSNDLGSRYVTSAQQVLAYKANYPEAGLGEWTRTVLKSWVYMWSKLVWPAPLAAEYVFAVPARWLDPWVSAALLGLAAYGIALWRCAVTRSRLLLPLVWVGVMYAPVANLWPLAYLAADRYMYLPLTGACLVAADLLLRAPRIPVPVTVSLVCCVALLFAVLTYRQNRVWASPESLWARAVEVSPKSAFAQNNLGAVIAKRGQPGDAIPYFQRALELGGGRAEDHYYNLGKAYLSLNRYQDAIIAFQHALQAYPGHIEARIFLGDSQRYAGDEESALATYETVLEADQESARAHYGMGMIHARRGELDAAVRSFARATELNPGDPRTFTSLGNVYFLLGRFDQAVTQYRSAIDLEPAHQEAHFNLAKSYEALGNRELAIAAYRRFLEVATSRDAASAGVAMRALQRLSADSERDR